MNFYKFFMQCITQWKKCLVSACVVGFPPFFLHERDNFYIRTRICPDGSIKWKIEIIVWINLNSTARFLPHGQIKHSFTRTYTYHCPLEYLVHR